MSSTDPIQLCDVHSIVTILYDDPALGMEKERLSGALGIPAHIIYDYEQRSFLDTYRFLTLMLNKWISKDGRVATRDRLIQVLRKEGFVNVSEKLQSISSSTDPVWFDVREDVNEFTGRETILNNLHKALTEQRNKRITVITTLHGLGGIGKTTLAVHYAWLCRENNFYQNVIWINAETIQTINDSFSRLAEQLGISTVDRKSKRLDLRQIVCKIYGHFNGKGNTLFILDNATNYESIEECLPPPKTPGLSPPFVLLTSRHTKWGDCVNPIPLDVFSEVESVEFLTNYLKLDTESEILFARNIAKLLDNLPLAVRQAGAYIKMQTRLGQKTKEESLEEYTTKFRHKSMELLGFKHWTETKDKNYEKTTLLTWDLTLERIIQENEHAEVIMHIIAYLNPDNIPTQLFEFLIPRPKDDTMQYNTWIERFRSLFGHKIGSNYAQSTGSAIMEAIELLADYSMINPQTSSRSGIVSVHRLVQRVVKIQTERAHKFSKLRDCVHLFERYFHSDNSSYETEILIHAQTLKDNIKDSMLSGKYKGFIRLVDRKLENLLEKKISLFEKMIDAAEYEKAFEMSRNPHLFGSNVSVYKLYLRGTFEIVLEHVENLIKSSNLEILAKVFTKFNQLYFLALYSNDTIIDDLWGQYGSLLSKCFNLCDRSKIAGHLIRKLFSQLVEYCEGALVHLKWRVDPSVLLHMTKDFISCSDGDGTPHNELHKLGFIRDFISVVEERAKQNIVAFVNFSLVSVMELTDYVHTESSLQVREEFVKIVHDTFIFSTSRLGFLMLLEFANNILFCFQRFGVHNGVAIILKEVILILISTSEHNSRLTVSEIKTMAKIIYEITIDKNFKHDTDLYSQLLHICKLNYNATRIHSVFRTADIEASIILHCLVELHSDVLEILEFSRKYVADFGYHGTHSSLAFEQFESMYHMVRWLQRLLDHGTRGIREGNERYVVLVHESLEISEAYFEKILAFQSTNLKSAYLALTTLKVRINCILCFEMTSQTSLLRSLYNTLNKPKPPDMFSQLEELFRIGVDVRNPDSFKHDVLKYLESIQAMLDTLETIPLKLELALVDILRLSAEVMSLSSDPYGALGKLKIARSLLNTSLAGHLESIEKDKHVILKAEAIQNSMKNV